MAELANAGLAQIVSFLGAAQGRLVTGVGAGGCDGGRRKNPDDGGSGRRMDGAVRPPAWSPVSR